MPTPENSFAAQDNIALENEVYTQVFGLDKDGKCWDMDFERKLYSRKQNLDFVRRP
ncbi:hypothetical protein Goari_018222 [Gossypium aridum]|uniref:Uncharacterized protein n=1 Tax=Gossypium aridum TaxID=34290 RepID=A0A7J8WPC8_GOSAI|nr:hypothetical protein [Gossypium aridum]